MEMICLGAVTAISVTFTAFLAPIFIRRKKPLTKEDWKMGRHE